MRISTLVSDVVLMRAFSTGYDGTSSGSLDTGFRAPFWRTAGKLHELRTEVFVCEQLVYTDEAPARLLVAVDDLRQRLGRLWLVVVQ
jgi:hypothetical protein